MALSSPVATTGKDAGNTTWCWEIRLPSQLASEVLSSGAPLNDVILQTSHFSHKFHHYCWFTFALFHKERQENHPEQSVLNISMAGAAEADPAVTSGCSKPRHALKQDVHSAQHKCLFSYDPKWNSAGLTREPCSASCTALLSKVFQKGSQELRQVSSTANSRSLNSQGICELGELLLEFKLL